MISNRIQFDINNFFANKNIENINEKQFTTFFKLYFLLYY